MDIGPSAQKSAGSKELLQHVQSATQSQQFKTMDGSKMQNDENEVSLKIKLQTSYSDKVDQVTQEAAAQEEAQAIDTKDLNLNLSKESEAVLPIANEVIEEQDEHDEEERKHIDHQPKPPVAAPPVPEYRDRSGPSTVKGQNVSSNGASNNHHDAGNSQSRIKVNLSQQEEEMMLGNDDHMIQTSKPMLATAQQQAQNQPVDVQPFGSANSTPHHAPMSK